MLRKHILFPKEYIIILKNQTMDSIFFFSFTGYFTWFHDFTKKTLLNSIAIGFP